MGNPEKRARCKRICCGVTWAVISLIVMMAAVAVTIALATRGSGYSIAAATVLVCLELLFLVVPAIGCGVFCCKAGRWEADVMLTTVVCSLASVLALAPFFYVVAAVLSIAEIALGKGDDDVTLVSLAVLAAVLNMVAAVASILLCVMSCMYVCRQRPGRATKQEEETLVMKKKEVKMSEMEQQEEKETNPFSP